MLYYRKLKNATRVDLDYHVTIFLNTNLRNIPNPTTLFQSCKRKKKDPYGQKEEAHKLQEQEFEINCYQDERTGGIISRAFMKEPRTKDQGDECPLFGTTGFHKGLDQLLLQLFQEPL